jgi:hypothetical protein
MQSGGSRFIWLAGALALMTANASAQSLPPINLLQLQQPQNHLTPEEQEQRDKLDDAYKAATKKIPDQKVHDPWADARETSTVPDPKKKQK